MELPSSFGRARQEAHVQSAVLVEIIYDLKKDAEFGEFVSVSNCAVSDNPIVLSYIGEYRIKAKIKLPNKYYIKMK